MLSEGEARARLLLPHDLIFRTEEDEQDFLLLALADAILVERDEHVVQNGDELVIRNIHAAVVKNSAAPCLAFGMSLST